MNKDSIFALHCWRIKSHISYIHFYWEWFCNGRCINMGLIETRNTVEQTAHFSLLEWKAAIKDNCQAISQGNRTSLFMAMNWTLLPRPPWFTQRWLHVRPSYTKCLRGNNNFWSWQLYCPWLWPINLGAFEIVCCCSKTLQLSKHT